VKKYLIERDIPKVGTLEWVQYEKPRPSQPGIASAGTGYPMERILCYCRQDVLRISG